LVDLVQLLVKHTADVNARDKYNNTPLRMCASNAQSFATIETFKQTVKILLDAGADINAGIPFLLLSSSQSQSIPLFILSLSHSLSLSLSHSLTVTLSGTTINTTSLHSVVKWGNLEALKFMLEHGADPNVHTTKKELPIDFAKDREVRGTTLVVPLLPSKKFV